MSSPLAASAVLFQDDFSVNGPLNSANWDFNHWTKDNNPSYLGQTQMRQNLPSAENGMARIKMDTYNPPPGKPDSVLRVGSQDQPGVGPHRRRPCLRRQVQVRR